MYQLIQAAGNSFLVTHTPSPTNTSPKANTCAPADYHEHGNAAWKWTDHSSYTCQSFQDHCVGVTVIARDGCAGGVFIAVAAIDGDRAAVGKDNDPHSRHWSRRSRQVGARLVGVEQSSPPHRARLPGVLIIRVR